MKLAGIFIAPLLLAACSSNHGQLGTEGNPIKMYFVPSVEAAKVVLDGGKVAQSLEKATGLRFKTAVPTNYAAVIEAMGSDEADIAWLATFAYVLAHDKYGAEVALTTTRNGMETYSGAIVARANSGIATMEACGGKRMAWVDPASTSGFVYPSALFKQKGIRPSAEIFAGGHPQAVLAVYEGSVDCAAVYYGPPTADGVIRDARETLFKTRPDVTRVVAVIGQTDPIPNDTVSFRKGFPSELRATIVESLLSYANSAEGKQVLMELYSIDGFVRSDDSRYQIVRDTLKALNKQPGELLPQPR